MTVVAVHQPNFLPHPGFFEKMIRADVFVFYDTAQYSKNDYHNRNRVKGPNGPIWLTVPVHSPSFRPIREVGIDNSQRWQERLWKTIEASYARASHFDRFSPDFKRILFEEKWQRLVPLNVRLIDQVRAILKLEAKTVLASTLRVTTSGDPTERLRDIVRSVGGDVYLSGPKGRDYLDRVKFGDIAVEFAEPVRTPYPQLWGAFVPNLSILDAILNCGADARQHLVRSDGL